MTSKIFEEALADAKKLKEVAEENAKKAILEAVAPKIREFIEGQLLEKDEEEVDEAHCNSAHEGDEELEEDITLDEAALHSLIDMVGGSDIFTSLKEGKSVITSSVRSALNNLSESERDKLLAMARKINKNVDNLSNTRINNNVAFNQENNKMNKNDRYYEVDLKALREAVDSSLMDEDYMEGMGHDSMEGMNYDDLEMEEGDYLEEDDHPMEEMGDYMEEEADMEDLINEIKLMIDLGDEVEGLSDELAVELMDDEEAEGEEDLEEEEEELEGAEEEGDMPDLFGAEGDEDEEEEEEEPEDLNEVFEVDPRMLRQEIMRVKRALREGKMDHHFGGKGGGKAGIDGAFGGKGKKNAGVKGAFGGGKEGQDPFVNPPQINKLNEAIRNLRRTNRAQSEKLNKYRSAVKTLREQLEDLNLFNAKLLYVNKLLQNKSLNESQKKSIIKALDEAVSLNEAKSLYKSLTESLASSGRTLNESTRYGSSSRATTSSARRGSQTASEIGRWQKLAGLK